MYDLPHETFNAFRDQATTTRVELMVLDKYVVTDKDGRKYEAYSSEGMTTIFSSGNRYVEPPYIESPDFDLSSAPTGGELDFGEGSIVSVREVLSRSSRVFSEHYRVDPRLFDDLLFVSGKYTKERFEGCMKRVMFLEPFRSVSESPELNELMDRLADRLQGINERLLENRGSRRTLQSLELSDPRAYARLVRSGIDPSTASVVVRPGFFLRMDPNVSVLLGTERRIVEGEEVLVTQTSQVLIGIGF
ncbi:MAG: hypothetical protein IIC73_08550 [Armatimonadetes bacterium]|nr:hypothetical protein [Armatimonadota bacterium]